MVTAGRRRAARLVTASALVLSVAACGSARMSSDQATQVAVDAFAAAGLDAEVTDVVADATVDRAGDGAFIQVHRVDLEVDGSTYEVGVSRTDGAVVRLVEPHGGLTDAEARAIAEYRDNPAAAGARARRAVVVLATLAIAAVAAAVLFRRARLAAEQAGAEPAFDEIPLD